MINKKIEPALTPEEWRDVADERAHPENYSGRSHQPLTGIAISYADGSLPTGYSLANPFTPHQLIALVNAALPDDDPRKITHADVDALLAAAYNQADAERRPSLRRVAAKLEAFLPPDITTYTQIDEGSAG